jgi:muramoyltetrapeptide carboxypeptidase
VAQDSFHMNLNIPSFLKTGDTLAIVATARWVTPAQLAPAIELIQSWGFRVKTGKHVYTQNFQLAGTDDERAADFQEALDDPEVKAILIARGGYGTIRVLDKLDFTSFFKSPKWICGYSDVTALHAFLNTRGVATIHSTMPISFPDATPEALENLRLALNGELKSVAFYSEAQVNNMETARKSAPVFGGNLSVLFSLLGSETFIPSEPYFLFVEDVDEMQYHMDRMMMGLKRSGELDSALGIIVGGLTQMKDNTMEFGFKADNPWGSSAEQTITRIGEELGVPVHFGFPAGHQSDNRAFYLGMPARIGFSEVKVLLTFEQ